MTFATRFLPEVEYDVMAGYAWYEEKAQGLGEEFLRAFYASIGEIRETPRLYPVIYRQFRRRLLRRFPYAVYFRISGSDVIVFGLFHCARNPRNIGVELRGRDDEDGAQ